MVGNISTDKTSAVDISGLITQEGIVAVTTVGGITTGAVGITGAEVVGTGAAAATGAEITTKQAFALLVVPRRYENRLTMTKTFRSGIPPKVRLEKHPRMTRISAKVLHVDRLGSQYLVTVQVAAAKYSGTFDRLSFGENKPHLGSYRSGWLDLAYEQNPGLKAGQSFPLWAIE
jgi:hypothetical protein